MLTAAQIVQSEAVIDCLQDIEHMLTDPNIEIDPLNYIKLKLHIETLKLQKLKPAAR